MKRYYILLLIIMGCIGELFAEPEFINFMYLKDITEIAAEKDTLWLGTSEGVKKINTYGEIIHTYDTTDGLVHNSVGNIRIDKDGNRWFGTIYGACKFDGNTWTTYDSTNGLTSNYIRDMEIDAIGDIWFATGKGVNVFDGEKWIIYTTANGLASDTITEIEIDADGNKWVMTKGGLNTFDGNTWTLHTPADSLPFRDVSSMAIEDNGDIWIGTIQSSLVAEYDGTKWNQDTLDATDVSINEIIIDNRGNIWFGTTHGGVHMFDGQKWIKLTPADGLVDMSIAAIAVDSDGNIWFGSMVGTSKLIASSIDIISEHIIDNSSHLFLNIVTNPFCNRATVSYYITERDNVNLGIYNVKGEFVKQLLSGDKNPGKHSTEFNKKDMASGIYFCRLETEKSGSMTRKITISK